MKNKRAQTGLRNGFENAILSKKLVTILKNVNLKVKIEDLEKKNIDLNACKKKFGELEFHAILKQLNNLGEQRSSEKYIELTDIFVL